MREAFLINIRINLEISRLAKAYANEAGINYSL